MKVKVYEFTDLKTGETFTGTSEEYQNKMNIAQSTLSNRIKRARVKRVSIGVKENGKTQAGSQKRFTKNWVDVRTGKTFTGTKKEAAEFYGLTISKVDTLRKKGLIQSSSLEDKNKRFKQDYAERERREKLRREVYRKQCLLKSFA